MLVASLVACMGGCANTRSASIIALGAGMQPITLPAAPFDLQGYYRPSAGGDLLRVYIEGDGTSWRSRTVISDDPTPKNPLALKLATEDPSTETVLYIARPCQYIQNPACSYTVWTDSRYSNEVVQSYEHALDFALEFFAAKRIVLVGYSGGGVVAVLLAARRSDISLVITIAAPLDHSAWTSIHGVSPLVNSLNPVDYALELREIRQVHYVGDADKIVPPSNVFGFLRKIGDPSSARVVALPEFTHHCCWREEWSSLINELVE